MKRLLEADYNAKIELKEPEKPNSLNMFLKFRKEMMNNSPVYKNLPPQPGLFDPDPEEEKNRILEEKASKIQSNIDFKILDADKDPETARSTSMSSLDEEDEVMDILEQNMVKKEGGVYAKESDTVFGDHGMVDSSHVV